MVPKKVSEAFVSAVEFGVGIRFAAVHDGAGTLKPHAEAGGVLLDLLGERLGQDGPISSEHKRRLVVQGREGLEKAGVSDCMVRRFGPAVPIGISKLPLGAHCKP